jgi:hypothetical protein
VLLLLLLLRWQLQLGSLVAPHWKVAVSRRQQLLVSVVLCCGCSA